VPPPGLNGRSVAWPHGRRAREPEPWRMRIRIAGVRQGREIATWTRAKVTTGFRPVGTRAMVADGDLGITSGSVRRPQGTRTTR